jgi:hypothetical protein
VFTQKETGMRPGLKSLLGTALAMALFVTPALAMADEATQIITSKDIATFDDSASAGNWIVQGSRYATKDFPQLQLVKTWPEAVYGKNKENKPLFSLGVHSRFDRKSYNYVEIIPAAKDSSGKLVPTALPLPGRVKSMNLWAWGSNFNYNLDAHIRDYQGIEYVLHFGSLQYAGWKQLSALVSTAIPQSRPYIPKYAGLELTKLVMWTSPEEKVDDNYLFIDNITVITDLYETRFDGEDLADPDTLNSLWQAGAK